MTTSTITPSSSMMIISACAYLNSLNEDNASKRNGVGFSKVDSDFGRDLGKKTDLTPRQAIAGLKMVRKYLKTQLEPAGFTLPTHIEEIVEVKVEQTVSVRFSDKAFVIRFPRNMPAYTSLIKKVDGWKYYPEKNHAWVMPVNPTTIVVVGHITSNVEVMVERADTKDEYPWGADTIAAEVAGWNLLYRQAFGLELDNFNIGMGPKNPKGDMVRQAGTRVILTVVEDQLIVVEEPLQPNYRSEYVEFTKNENAKKNSHKATGFKSGITGVKVVVEDAPKLKGKAVEQTLTCRYCGDKFSGYRGGDKLCTTCFLSQEA